MTPACAPITTAGDRTGMFRTGRRAEREYLLLEIALSGRISVQMVSSSGSPTQ